MNEIRKLYNCTAHDQSDTHDKILKEFAFDVELRPRIKRVDKNPETAKVEMEDLEKEAISVADGVPAHSHVLVGGAGPLIERLSMELLTKQCRCYSVTATRTTRPNGCFQFNISGLDETPLSRDYHVGKFKIIAKRRRLYAID